MSALLDESALTDLAERLVAAARRAGADAADAVAVRSVSLGVEVREGAVEELRTLGRGRRGLRVFVGRVKRSCRPTTQGRRGAARGARGRHGAGSLPTMPSLALPIRRARARDCRSRPARPRSSDRCAAGKRAKRAEDAGLAIKGVTKSGGASASAGIGGMVLVTSAASAAPISIPARACR